MAAHSEKASMLMVCYNHEKFIEEAVRAALNQDYENLQIVISDDASTDRTYDIAKNVVDGYRGNKEIVLNRNEKNIGAIPNYNKAASLISGEFIVQADGDDISMPHRVSSVMKAWRETRIPVITSNCYRMDVDGNVGDAIAPLDAKPDMDIVTFARAARNACCYGAALNFSKALFDTFGPVDQDRSPFNIDHIIPAWGLLAGGNSFLPEPLVYHRRHSAGATFRTVSFSDQENYDETSLAHGTTQAAYALLEFWKAQNSGNTTPMLGDAVNVLISLVLQNTLAWTRVRNRHLLKGYSYEWKKPALS